MPERTGGEGSQAGAEAGFLALGRDAEVDVVAQPVIGVLVPVAQISVRVLRRLHSPGIDVLQPIPEDLACLRVKAVVSHAG